MSKHNTLASEQLTDAMYYILLALVKERHGYAIMKFIEELSDAHVMIGPGTLYTLLKKLCDIGWIQPMSMHDDRTKTYKISEKGLQVLRKDYERRCHMVEEGKQVLTEAGYEK